VKQVIRILATIGIAAAVALIPARVTAQMIALTPGTINTIAGAQGQTTNPANGTVALGHSIGNPGNVAIAPVINGAGGDIYFDNCNAQLYNCSFNYTLYVIYEGGAAAKAMLAADGVSSPAVGKIYSVNPAGGGTGPASLAGLTVDAYGNVVVSDWGYGRLYVYYVGTVAGQGTNPADALLSAEGITGLQAGYTYRFEDGGVAPYGSYVDSAENVFFYGRQRERGHQSSIQRSRNLRSGDSYGGRLYKLNAWNNVHHCGWSNPYGE